MLEPQVHTILRQILEVETSTASRTDGTALADAWSQVSYNQLPALLQHAFDAAVPAHGLLRINQLEIVLEAEPGESPEATLSRELPGKLARALAATPKPEENVDAITSRGGDWVVFFLQYGYLPWSAPAQMTVAELEYRLTESVFASGFLIRRVRELLLRDRAALQRVLFWFSTATSWRILLALHPVAERTWSAADRRQWLEQGAPALRVARWQKLLQVPETTPELIARMEEPDPKLEAEAVKDPAATVTGTPIFIGNAGLVLLHPFLARLFRAVGYAEGEELADRDRAVHLVHYLATGTAVEGEWQLVLPKILCGMALKEVVDSGQLPGAEAKAAADEMLRAVIRHWSALKNTSIEGLRTSFLQREGRLIRSEDHWSLRVAQRPFDLLLDHLPWGIRVYRLPWMTERMAVEWV